MNIFVLDEDPVIAAQMMASALRRHGATDEQMPFRKDGKSRYKGGYKNHPCTRWAGDSRDNFKWLARHAQALLTEYSNRFDKVHACNGPIHIMSCKDYIIPEGGLMHFAQAMPDEYKDVDAVKAYRAYYKSKVDSPGGVHYRHTSPPDWWGVTA